MTICFLGDSNCLYMYSVYVCIVKVYMYIYVQCVLIYLLTIHMCLILLCAVSMRTRAAGKTSRLTVPCSERLLSGLVSDTEGSLSLIT